MTTNLEHLQEAKLTPEQVRKFILGNAKEQAEVLSGISPGTYLKMRFKALRIRENIGDHRLAAKVEIQKLRDEGLFIVLFNNSFKPFYGQLYYLINEGYDVNNEQYSLLTIGRFN